MGPNRYTRVGRPTRADVRLTDDVVRATLRWATRETLTGATTTPEQVDDFARRLRAADRLVGQEDGRPLSARALTCVYQVVGAFAMRSTNEMLRVAIDDATWRLLFGLRVLESRMPRAAWAEFGDAALQAVRDRDADAFSDAAEALHAAVLGADGRLPRRPPRLLGSSALFLTGRERVDRVGGVGRDGDRAGPPRRVRRSIVRPGMSRCRSSAW